jgi:hypothetical protein
MNTTEQGRIGEAAIVAELVKQGYEVYHPMFGNTSCDLVVIKDSVISRVECKTATTFTGTGYVASLRQVRYNRSEVVYNKFKAVNSDILAVYIVPLDEVHILNSIDYDDRTSVTLRAKG